MGKTPWTGSRRRRRRPSLTPGPRVVAGAGVTRHRPTAPSRGTGRSAPGALRGLRVACASRPIVPESRRVRVASRGVLRENSEGQADHGPSVDGQPDARDRHGAGAGPAVRAVADRRDCGRVPGPMGSRAARRGLPAGRCRPETRHDNRLRSLDQPGSGPVPPRSGATASGDQGPCAGVDPVHHRWRV